MTNNSTQETTLMAIKKPVDRLIPFHTSIQGGSLKKINEARKFINRKTGREPTIGEAIDLLLEKVEVGQVRGGYLGQRRRQS
jgi:hypothetical protein